MAVIDFVELRPALVDNEGALKGGPKTEKARVPRPVPTYPAPGGSNGPGPLDRAGDDQAAAGENLRLTPLAEQ
jgi:hypothetical protein